MLDQCAVKLIEVKRQRHRLQVTMRDSFCAMLFFKTLSPDLSFHLILSFLHL